MLKLRHNITVTIRIMIDYSRKSHSVAFTKLELRCVILNSVNKQVSTVYYTSSVSVISCGCATQGTIHTDTEAHNRQHSSQYDCWLSQAGTLAKAVTQSAGGLAARRAVAWHRASCSAIGQYASAELAWSSPHFVVDLSYECRCGDFPPYRRKRKYVLHNTETVTNFLAHLVIFNYEYIVRNCKPLDCNKKKLVNVKMSFWLFGIL